MIKLRTMGRGVDFVLNTFSNTKMKASIRCLGHAGVFLDIGKFGLSKDTTVAISKQMSFRSVLDDDLFLLASDEMCCIRGLIERDIVAGIVQPLKSTVYEVNNIELAYRSLSAGQNNIGKALIQIRQDPEDVLSMPISSLPKAYFDANKVYIILGGLGGFGLELINWMISRGARHVVISSSKGLSSTYQEYRIK